MPRLTALNRQNWNVGEYESAELPIPLDATKVTIEFERNSWPELSGSPPNNEVISVIAEISLDDGQTWNHLITGGTVGGDLYSYKTGELHTRSWMTIPLPEPDNPSRRGRVRMIVRAQLNTQIDVDIA